MTIKRKVEEINLEHKGEKINDKKRFNYVLILLLITTLLIGGTYAYFLFTVGTDNVNVQSTNSVSLSYSDNRDNMNKNLIPTSRENLLKGISKDKDKCIDVYGFSACSLYEFTISNDSDVSQIINISMLPLENKYQNLEFMLYSGKIDDITEDTEPIITNQKLNYNSLTPVSFNGLTETILANDDVSYTLVFYILNKNENQTSDDSNKVFRANISVNSITTGQYINKEINS